MYPVASARGTDCAFPSASFAPTDITGLELWLKADAGVWQDSAKTTAADEDDDPVGAWEDQSGNGNDATQDTAGNKLAWKNNIVNGKPALLGDGTHKWLDFTTAIGTPDITIFAVARNDDAAVGSNWIGYSGDWWPYLFSDGTPEQVMSSIRSTTSVASGTTSDFHLACLWHDGVNMIAYCNGAAGNTRPDTQSADFDRVGYFAANWAIDGYIAEVVIYDSALSESDRQSVEDFLNDKYDLY